MYDQTIKLISDEQYANEYGDIVSMENERTVFAELKSISQSEFYQARAMGLKPELKFVLPDYLEYRGETKLKYPADAPLDENAYTIIRTFRKGNELEIICKRGVE